MCQGRDLTQLPGHTHYGVLQLIGEVGTDLTKWPSEKHFTAWMGLAPGNHDSGKRKGRAKRGRNRAGRLFCVMARSLVRSKDIALGGFYRRMAARRGGLIATMALARKLAALFWRSWSRACSLSSTGSRSTRLRSCRLNSAPCNGWLSSSGRNSCHWFNPLDCSGLAITMQMNSTS
jgi:hypothetical protein